MNNNQDGNRPKLKKIKRPINRTMPMDGYTNPMQRTTPAQNSETSVSVQNQGLEQSSSQPSVMLPQKRADFYNSEELNEYLDGTKNISNTNQKNNDYYDPPTSYTPEWLNLKVFIMGMLFFIVLGVLAGKFLFSQSAVVHNGLQGVVINSEVPRGRARCGIAERSQGCVLYIMNPQRQEMSAKDFYDLASQMTGRQRFMIETGNMRYANSRIKPGDIAQLNIPPL